MPIHPSQSAKFHLLEGIESFEQGMADPVTRARLDEFMSITDAPAPPAVDVRETAAPGPHGPVPVRDLLPRRRRVRPARVVWLHGGAFRMGDLDMPEADWAARQVCERAGAVVVSVDYRLAVGGVTYPVPHDDVVAAVRWVRDSAADLGIDPERISSAAPVPAATSRPVPRCASGTTTDGCPRPCCWRTRPSTRSSRRRRRPWRRCWRRSRGCCASCPRTALHRRELPGWAGQPCRRLRDAGRRRPRGACPVLLLNSEYDDLRASAEVFAGRLAVAGVDVRQVLVPACCTASSTCTPASSPSTGPRPHGRGGRGRPSRRTVPRGLRASALRGRLAKARRTTPRCRHPAAGGRSPCRRRAPRRRGPRRRRAQPPRVRRAAPAAPPGRPRAAGRRPTRAAPSARGRR